MSSEYEEGFLERVSTPLPRERIPNYRVVLEISRSSAEAVTDDEEYFDVSAESLVIICKKMRLNSKVDCLESEMGHQQEDIIETQEDEELPDSPESSEESLNSEVFVVEKHWAPEESTSSSNTLKNLEQTNREDSSSYVDTPPGPLRKINPQPISPLNDLKEKKYTGRNTTTSAFAPKLSFLPRQPGRGVRPTSVALSQPAPGLGCCRKRKELAEVTDAA